MVLSDLLQGCSNKSDTGMIKQDCHEVDKTRLQRYSYIMIVKALLEQPCNNYKSDSINKIATSC